MSDLVIPKLAVKAKLEVPNIHKQKSTAKDIVPINILPNGNLAKVPTGSTGERIKREECIEEEIDLGIFLRETDPANLSKIRSLNEGVSQCQKLFKLELYPLIPGTFETMLNIYENNQSYYSEQIKNNTYTSGLKELEVWFRKMIEPEINIFCDPNLISYT